jgi:hypothetical protein
LRRDVGTARPARPFALDRLRIDRLPLFHRIGAALVVLGTVKTIKGRLPVTFVDGVLGNPHGLVAQVTKVPDRGGAGMLREDAPEAFVPHAEAYSAFGVEVLPNTVHNVDGPGPLPGPQWFLAFVVFDRQRGANTHNPFTFP